MGIRNSTPVSFVPIGITDATDTLFQGSCNTLSNLIFDRKNRGAMVPRPGAIQATNFPSFTSPGVISAMLGVGTRIYGLIASGRNAGFDEPFVYDTATSAFITLSGVTASNVPSTPSTAGAWNPPTMDVVGTRVLVTHPGFSGTNYFGFFDTGGFSGTQTATTTAGSAVLTAVSATTNFTNGMAIAGAGIPAGTVVLSVTPTTVTMSASTTAAATGITITVTGGTFLAPAWGAGNTSTNALPSTPIWVAQFYNRAYFGCGNAVYFSDSLNPLNITNLNFSASLTLGDTSPTKGSSGLAFSTSSAGILQSLVVFKANTIYQVSGDISLSGNQSLSLNLMSANIGCTMPRTAQSTPYGVLFIANDGPRLVDLRGQIKYLHNEDEDIPNLLEPFANATTPSRACSGYNNSAYRVSLDTYGRDTTNTGVTYAAADYWYDFLFSRWTGRHTFKYNICTTAGTTFYVGSNATPGILFQSDVTPSSSTVYTDAGTTYTCVIQSTVLPLGESMTEKALVESTIELSDASTSIPYLITGYDDRFNQLSSCTINVFSKGSTWGTSVWGAFSWSNPFINNHVYTMPWSSPLVFKKMIMSISVTAQPNVSIRKMMLRYQTLGFVNA